MKNHNKFISFIKSFVLSVKISWKSSWKLFILRIFFEFFSIINPMLLAYIFKIIVDLFLLENLTKNAIMLKLLTYILLITAVRISSIFVENIKRLFTNDHNELINNKIELIVLEKINELDVSFFDNPNFHNEMLNVYKDAKAMQELSFMVITFVRAVIQLISCSLILSSYIGVYIPFLVAMFTFPSIFVDNRIIKKRYLWEKETALQQRKINYFKSILTGGNFSKDIRVYHTKDFFKNKYISSWSSWFNDKRKISRKGAFLSVIAQMFPYATLYMSLFIVGIRIINNELSIGDFTFLNGIVTQFIGGLTTLFSQLNKAYEAEYKLFNFGIFLNLESKIKNIGKLSLNKINKIEFCSVSFRYPNTENKVLDNVNFVLHSKQTTALVGVNGAGKTTIIKLLLRLYDPDSGKILINGINIREYDLESLHKCIGVVFQDFNTYELSLRQSVSISEACSSNDERIIEACKYADFDINPNIFLNGLDTYIGKSFDEDGVILSGGQKQKLAIAQAYFKNSHYYIMDEPNSSLDPESESRVIEKLMFLAKNKGALFITHKLSTTAVADKIIVLENGKIVEQGTHTDLMKNEFGKYKKLYMMQSKNYCNNILTN